MEHVKLWKLELHVKRMGSYENTHKWFRGEFIGPLTSIGLKFIDWIVGITGKRKREAEEQKKTVCLLTLSCW